MQLLLKMDSKYVVIIKGVVLLAITYICFSLQGNRYIVNLHAVQYIRFLFICFLKTHFNGTACHHLAFTIFF